jgi:hypothetical protein
MQAGDCALAFGDYQGNGTVCDPTPCSQPGNTGACCTESGCTTRTAEDCATNDGFYAGNGVPCNPDPCPDPGDLLGIWDIEIITTFCDTDSAIFSFAVTDTVCSVDDPYEGDPDPETDEICKYEVDGNELVATCRSSFEFNGCVQTTISVIRFTFGNGSYTGSGISRTTGTGACSTHQCFTLEYSATRTGPAPDPCPESNREDQMRVMAAEAMRSFRQP